MDSEAKQRKSDKLAEAANGQAGTARSIKHVRRRRTMTVETSDGPIVIDLSQCTGQVRYVPVVVPVGVVVRFEDIQPER